MIIFAKLQRKQHIYKLQMLQNEIKSSFIELGQFLAQFSESKTKEIILSCTTICFLIKW